MVVRSRLEAVTPNVTCFRDTCNVYVLRAGRDAVLVDFGDGDVLDCLDELGVERVTDVLLTHHHRDQLGGLRRAVEAGIRVWAPPFEAPLVADADGFWRRRRTMNDYDVRDDRFTLLESVPIAGSVAEYRTARHGPFDVRTLPTPGHTLGSVTYLVEIDGRRLAFSGDLVYGEGKVWSLAATQWTYSGIEGYAATVISCAVLAGERPDVLLPAHGDVIESPLTALSLTADRMQELLNLRSQLPWDLGDMTRSPWAPVTPHFLRSRASFASSYVLVSGTGAALVVDFGYEVTTGLTPITEYGAKRPLLWMFDALRRDHGVDRIEAVVPTHYHDDHVAGLELLREVEGAEVWAPANVAPILEDPERYDLPCLWYEPIPVDRRLALGETVRWHEYELTVHPLPGHTMYAAAFSFEVDGTRILATGDQQTNDGPSARSVFNYQYRNRFRPHDYVASAELYRSLRPEIIVSGHWLPLPVTPELLDQLLADGHRLEELHRDLLPDDGLGAEGFAARIEPYRSHVAPGGGVELDVEVTNPSAAAETARVALVVPRGWSAPPPQEVELGPGGEAVVRFAFAAGEVGGRVAADVTIGTRRLGQQAEAHVHVEPEDGA